jgi:hypothetical protein
MQVSPAELTSIYKPSNMPYEEKISYPNIGYGGSGEPVYIMLTNRKKID